jgi:putative tryptophan/tyrosine transport system substrate-binding protein
MPNISGKMLGEGVLALVTLLVLFATVVRAATLDPLQQEHIAVVVNQQDVPYEEVLVGFRNALKHRAAPLILDMFNLTMNEEEQLRIIDELQSRQPKLILALGSVALQAVSREIKDTPIIFGLVLGNMDRPLPDNITGVYLDFPLETQLTWLSKILPERRNIGVIYNPEQNRKTIVAAKKVAQRLGLRLIELSITSPQELPVALDALASSADVFWGINDQLVLTPQTAKTLLLFSFRNRIPFIGLSDAWVKAGALFALDRDYPDIGRQCAELAEKILSGSRVKDLPTETPQKVKYILNRHTAEQIMLKFPTRLLQGAEKIY